MITERALRRACLAGQVDEGERFQTKVLRLGWCSVYRSLCSLCEASLHRVQDRKECIGFFLARSKDKAGDQKEDRK
jgi:hypothetical protein